MCHVQTRLNTELRMNTCAKCPSRVRAVLQVIGVIVIFLLVLLAVFWGDKKKADHNRTWADVILSRFKIIVSFYQVIIAVFSALFVSTGPPLFYN